MRLEQGEIRTSYVHAQTALPLPLAGEGWGGGVSARDTLRLERAPTRIASCDAMRPPPQAGEVKGVCGRSRTRFLPALLLTLTIPLAAHADEKSTSRAQTLLSQGTRFTETTGADLFASACQGCHMPDGKGAIGAGAYPSLVQDRNLESGGYPVTVVVRGLRGMPPVGAMMSDAQVAAVVNYVRTHFGNRYQDAVSAEDVKQVRP
jgi:mono/diheme cytochrome c family protein